MFMHFHKINSWKNTAKWTKWKITNQFVCRFLCAPLQFRWLCREPPSADRRQHKQTQTWKPHIHSLWHGIERGSDRVRALHGCACIDISCDTPNERNYASLATKIHQSLRVALGRIGTAYTYNLAETKEHVHRWDHRFIKRIIYYMDC